MGQLLIEIQKEHPDEYDRSCRGFVDEWRQTEFERGSAFLDNEHSLFAEPAKQIKQTDTVKAPPAAQMLSL